MPARSEPRVRNDRTSAFALTREPAPLGEEVRPLPRVLYVTSQWDLPTGRAPFVRREVEALRNLGVAVDVLGYRGGWSPLAYWRAIRRMRNRLRDGAYDVVHARFGQCGIVALAQRRVPVVVTFGGSDVQGSPAFHGAGRLRHHLLRAVSRAVAKRADEVIVVAEHLARHLPRASIHVISTGVDLDLFRPLDRSVARARLGLHPTRLQVLFVGNPANRRKRFSLAASACRIAARQLPLDLVALHGRSPEEVPWYMSACDALILTSSGEGSPNAIKEALACELPVVSVRVGDAARWLERTPGSRIAEDDRAGTLADALLGVLRTERRPASRSVVECVAACRVAGRIVDVYRAAMGRRGVDARQASTYLRVRPMQRADLDAVTGLHRTVFPQSVSAAVGRRYFEWLLAEPDAIRFVAVDGDRVVGYQCGAPDGYSTSLYRELWPSIVTALLGHPRLLVRPSFLRQLPMRLGNLAGRRERRGIGLTGAGSRTVVSIILGVHADYRRSGVASRLIRAFAAESWARGFDRVSTSIFESNVPTRRLYERAGWRLALSARTLRFILDRPAAAGGSLVAQGVDRIEA